MNINNFCLCDCHKIWGSIIPPVCTCQCSNLLMKHWSWNTDLTENTLQLCKHLKPVKLGCEECKQEESSLMANEMEKVYKRIEKLENGLSKSELSRLAFNESKCWKGCDDLDGRIERLEEILPRYDELHKEWMDRIEKLESRIIPDFSESIKHDQFVDGQIKRLDCRFESTESRIEKLENLLNSIDGIKEICKAINELLGKLVSKDTKPHRCHVCNGSGYQSEKSFHECSACEGKGVLWG